ncbi:MAG TPA: pyrroloquinoline quinone biosynthesis protein PqqB [Casimicrobiaceae bacterium]|nr:pyrroloquinoline quinone biosynthesis protein PqqB [Casimicrobiaceae bacterium]
MRVKVLGSAAGGGFPQWNCNCRNCAGLREGRLKARRRTQSSIAVSADGGRWVLCNASPDIAAQIFATPELQAPKALRGSGIAAVVLTDGQIDHAAGLLLLREGSRLQIHTTDLVRDELTGGLPVLSLLEHFCGVDWHRIPLDATAFDVDGIEGLELRALPIAGKPAPFSPRRDNPQPGDNIGLTIHDRRTQRSLFYAPGLARIDERVADAMKSADCLLVDGTFWTDDEMIRLGVGSKRAQDIGHLPQAGPGGMIERLRAFPNARRVLVHINNTNPILDEDSAERRLLEREGIEVAFDGMELVL